MPNGFPEKNAGESFTEFLKESQGTFLKDQWRNPGKNLKRNLGKSKINEQIPRGSSESIPRGIPGESLDENLGDIKKTLVRNP